MRCAIYARKSTEEGLEQAFNSLEVQREAAEAYIRSQQAHGWQLVAERYDDGGYSGANLERPALRKLLDDMEARAVDAVVVYKVDRLSRSLLDFARLMEKFEQCGVSLVSVTQRLDTTASLGRLTLNILLSFAQFEREIIAERTRDRMGAARRKGKWAGGIPVLGYDVDPGGGKLVVNATEAEQVRTICRLYLQWRAVPAVLEEMERRQWKTKAWVSRGGRAHEGRRFTPRSLVRLLRNRLYVGQVHYRGGVYAGEHVALLEPRHWQRVQELLQAEQRLASTRRNRAPVNPAALAGGGDQTDENPRPEKLDGVPRITRLLALALRFESLLRTGVVKDYAELARLGQVSRARITQIMNLVNLAPDIQEQILLLSRQAGRGGVRETTVRKLSSVVLWSEQRHQWNQISPTTNGTHLPGDG